MENLPHDTKALPGYFTKDWHQASGAKYSRLSPQQFKKQF